MEKLLRVLQYEILFVTVHSPLAVDASTGVPLCRSETSSRLCPTSPTHLHNPPDIQGFELKKLTMENGPPRCIRLALFLLYVCELAICESRRTGLHPSHTMQLSRTCTDYSTLFHSAVGNCIAVQNCIFRGISKSKDAERAA